MFIKFKFKNTSRKIKKEISSFEELKQQAVQIFGDQVIYCDFLYEDEDCELVNIVEDVDLETCYEEAKENGVKSIKIFLELSSPKTKRARSISQKKKGVIINESENVVREFTPAKTESESDSDSDFEAIEVSTDSDNSIEIKMNKKYEKLEKKLNKKMNKLRKKKRQQMRDLKNQNSSVSTSRSKSNKKGMPQFVKDIIAEKKKNRSHSRSKSNKKRNKHNNKKRHGKNKGMPSFVKDIINSNKKAGFPWKTFKLKIQAAKEELKFFRGNPELIAKVVDLIGDNLVNVVKDAVETIKTENPELVNELLTKRAEKEEKKQTKRLAGLQRKELKQKRKQEMREKKQEIKAARKAAKQARKLAKIAKNSPIELETQDLSSSDRNQEVRRRVNILVPIFKDCPRPELRKKVIEDMEAGKDIQATIQSLFA